MALIRLSTKIKQLGCYKLLGAWLGNEEVLGNRSSIRVKVQGVFDPARPKDQEHRSRQASQNGSPRIKDASQDILWGLTKSVIDDIRMISAIHEEDWREQIEAYLRRESNPREGSEEEKRMQRRAQIYLLISDKVYKAGICGPYLRCIARDEGRQLLTEIHQGLCRSHIGFRALAAKAYRQGFF